MCYIVEKPEPAAAVIHGRNSLAVNFYEEKYTYGVNNTQW